MKLRRAVLVLLTLVLPACGTWQCAAGNNIQQTIEYSALSQIAFVLVAITLFLLMLAVLAGPRWGDGDR